ncbi:MAG: transketolase [Ruminococcaceae bacterium]|nr:transketolase [Oscillospiraceae bacterium]
MRGRTIDTILSLAKQDRDVLLVTGDLGFGVLKPYWEGVPNQFLNAGIAEQNLTGLAAGMALEGKTVFTYSIGNFPTLRCYEQIRNDCAYHNANVKVICVGGGFVYGSLGMSHHATEDISALRALPNVTVLAPADADEAEACVRAMYETPGTFYLRLGRGGEPMVRESLPPFEIGKALKARDGERVVIFSTGAIFDEVQGAIELLKNEVSPAAYTFPTVKPIDAACIEGCAKKYDLIVTVEENTVIGGFGSAVAEVLARKSCHARQLMIGIEDTYSSIVGTQKYLRDHYGISAERISQRIRDALK